MKTIVSAAALAAAALLYASMPASAQTRVAQDSSDFSFVVVGHLRGGSDGERNFMFDLLLREIRELKPNAVFLTGDLIWGSYQTANVDPAVVTRDWQMLDSALATLGIPVYRVPGNHDINDPVTRDVFFQRYGRYPQVVDMAGIRFVLLNSTYVPPDGPLKGTHRPYIGGVPIDSAQVAFLQSALAEGQPYRRAFVFTHHVLWWKQDAPWWTTVHPVLRDRRVAGVFAGDYGPMKFSHAVRDSIDYIQSTVENLPGIRILQRIEASRLLYQQFDNFLHVTVRGTDVDIDVKVLGAMEGGKFTPERFQQITSYEPTVKERLRTMFGSSKRIAALIVSVLAVFAVGAFTGSMWRARRA